MRLFSRKIISAIAFTTLGWGIYDAAAGLVPNAVREISLVSDGEVDRPAVLESILLKPGLPFSQALLDKSLQRLGGSFRLQSVTANFDDETGVLEFNLSLLPILSKIDVHVLDANSKRHAEAVVEDLLPILGFTRGDPIFLDSIAEIRERITTRLHDRGYLNPQVLLALEQKESQVQRDLVVNVELGQRSVVQELRLQGFRASDVRGLQKNLQASSELKQILDTVTGPTHLLQEKIRKLQATATDREPQDWTIEETLPLDWLSINEALNRWGLEFKENGFYDFQYQAHVEEKDGKVLLYVNMSRGIQYNIQFTGNVAFWERDLRARVLDRTLRFGVPFSAADSELLVTRLYEANGYADFMIRVHNEGNEDRRKITFDITEGQKYFLAQVALVGIHENEKTEMAEVVREWLTVLQNPLHPIYYDEKLLKSVLPELLKKIRDRGFLQARILEFEAQRKAESQRVPVNIAVQLGPRSRIRHLSVLGNIALSADELNRLIDVGAGAPVSPTKIAEINQRLVKSYQELGFMFAEVNGDEDVIFKNDADSAEVDIELQIEPGPQVQVGRVSVDGLRDTHSKVVLRELNSKTLQSGQMWTPSGRDKLEERLLSLGIFSNAHTDAVGGRVIESPPAENRAVEVQEKDLKITVAERPGGTIEFGPGYRTDLGAIGFAEWNYRNLGGWNREVRLRSQLSAKLDNYQFVEQRYGFAYIEPFLLLDHLRFQFGTNYSKEDKTIFSGNSKLKGYNLEEVSVSFGVEKEFGKYFRLFQNLYTVSLPRFFDVIDLDSQDNEKYKIATIGTTLTFDNRNNLLNPSDGVYLGTNFEYSGPKIGSSIDAHYIKLGQDFATYLKLAPRAIVAFSLSYERLWGLGGSQGVPLNKRLVLGGQASIRSLREGFLAFNNSGLLNQERMEAKIEYRQPVLTDLGLAFFYDTGRLDSFNYGNTGWRKAAGVGIRYETAVGPLALDFAYNLDVQPNEDTVKVQFGIGRF